VREHHLHDGPRCNALVVCRDTLVREGLYTGPHSPLEMDDNTMLLHNFPGDAAAVHQRRLELNEIACGPDAVRPAREERLASLTAVYAEPWLDQDGLEIDRVPPSPAAAASPATAAAAAAVAALPSAGSTAPDSAQVFGPQTGWGSLGRTPFPHTAQPVASPPGSPQVAVPGRRRELSFAAQAMRAASDSPPSGYAEPASPQGYSLAGLTLPLASPAAGSEADPE